MSSCFLSQKVTSINQHRQLIRPKQIYVCFLSHAQIQKLVGRSAFFVVVAKRNFAQTMVKNVKTVFFGWFLYKNHPKNTVFTFLTIVCAKFLLATTTKKADLPTNFCIWACDRKQTYICLGLISCLCWFILVTFWDRKQLLMTLLQCNFDSYLLQTSSSNFVEALENCDDNSFTYPISETLTILHL